MTYTKSLFAIPYCILTMILLTVAAPRPSSRQIIGDEHLELENKLAPRNQTNMLVAPECYSRSLHPLYAGPVVKEDCFTELYFILKDPDADIPIRWDMFPAQSPNFVFRSTYRTCTITMRKRFALSADRFPPLVIAQQAAAIIDECVDVETDYFGGHSLVGPRRNYDLEVTNVLASLMTGSNNTVTSSSDRLLNGEIAATA